MASSFTNDPFERGACLPCCSGFVQSQNQAQNHHAHIVPMNRNDTDKLGVMKQTEDLLASELNKLSVQERSDAFDDMHCVGEELKETEEMVQKSLADFEQAIQKQHANCRIYKLAMSQNRAFVEDPKFRLKFLRFNSYDVDKSVRQMMNFLQYKAKYFGEDKVAREIGVSDLTDREIDLMLSLYHIRQERDRMGRVILFGMGLKKELSGYGGVDAMIRVIYYTYWNVLLAIPDVQVKGVASIFHAAFFKLQGMDIYSEILPFYNSLPLRVSVIHFCREKSPGGNNPSLIDGLLRFLLKSLPQQTRVRTRIHYGSSMEIQYQLQSHGIPTDTFPLGEEGRVREDILSMWFKKHLKETNQTFPFHRTEVAMAGLTPSTGERLVEPTMNDVLLGRGRGNHDHPGNVRFREYLKVYQEEYNNTPRYTPFTTSKELTRLLLENGVRFLRKTESGDGWVEVSFSAAENKVKQLFRTRKKMRKTI